MTSREPMRAYAALSWSMGIVRSMTGLEQGDALTIRFADGEVSVRVGETGHRSSEEDRGE